MNTLIKIILLSAIFQIQSVAQDYPFGDIFFTTQEQIDDFIISYPDCKYIEGDLFISGSQLENIDALSKIEITEGLLVLDFAIGLVNKIGLSSLKEICQGIEITQNSNLETIDEIANIDVLSNKILISNNQNLKLDGNINLDILLGFNKRKYLEKYFRISGNIVSTSDQSSIGNRISIAPDPAVDEIMIDLPEEIKVTARNLYSGKARSLLTGTDRLQSIDVSYLDNDIYLLYLETNHGSVTKKITVTV
jgi:hypothetical protein